MARVEKLIPAYARQIDVIEKMAERASRDMESIGVSTHQVEPDDLAIDMFEKITPMLFMTSAAGNEAPFTAELFNDQTMAAPAMLTYLRFGLLCACDGTYENFCGFGHHLRDCYCQRGPAAI